MTEGLRKRRFPGVMMVARVGQDFPNGGGRLATLRAL